jgi:hypothetical protein
MPFPIPLVCDLNKRALHLICENFEPRGTEDVPTSSKMYRIPHYQRFYTWPLHYQQKFIISILQNYPIPSIMLSRMIENDEEYFMVEDGQQRLTTAYRFLRNEFCIEIDGEEFTYSQLPEELRIQFRGFDFQTNTWRARDLTLIRRIEIFQRTNDHKSLTDNDRFHSCKDLPMGQCMVDILSKNHEPISKYFGSIGKGKTRGGLADFAGMCITLSKDESACLTTSYYKNGEYMRTTEKPEKIQPFLDAYFEVLEANVGKKVTKFRRIYGKLSGILGLAVHSYLFHEEIHPALVWYIGKLLSNKKYMPSTFKKLGAGDIRNCQSNAIEKRFDAIVEQHATDPEDTGTTNGDDSESDDE